MVNTLSFWVFLCQKNREGLLFNILIESSVCNLSCFYYVKITEMFVILYFNRKFSTQPLMFFSTNSYDSYPIWRTSQKWLWKTCKILMSIWIQEDITGFDNFWMKFGQNWSVCRLSKGCTIAQKDIHTYYIPRDM